MLMWRAAGWAWGLRRDIGRHRTQARQHATAAADHTQHGQFTTTTNNTTVCWRHTAVSHFSLFTVYPHFFYKTDWRPSSSSYWQVHLSTWHCRFRIRKTPYRTCKNTAQRIPKGFLETYIQWTTGYRNTNWSEPAKRLLKWRHACSYRHHIDYDSSAYS